MLKLLFQLGKFLADSVIVYAASDQGKAELIAIANEVEAAGVDIPFYEPNEVGISGEQGSEPADFSEFVNKSDFNTDFASTRKIFPKVAD